MDRRAGGAALLTAALVTAQPIARAVAAPDAQAEPAPAPALPGVTHLPDGAAAYATLRPLDLADGFALLDLLSGVFPEAGKRLQAARDGFGFYALSRAEFADDGIDPDAPVLLAWGMIDQADWARQAAAAADASLARTKKPEAPIPVYARHRLVVKTVDAAKFRRYVAALLGGIDAQVGSPVRGKGDPPTPKWFPIVRSAAGKGGALLVAKTPSGGLLTLRRSGEFALVDFAEPWPAPSGDEKRDLPNLVARMLAPTTVPANDAFARGSGRLLSEPASMAVSLQPEGLAALMPDGECRRSWSVAGGALIADAALSASLHPFESRVSVAWGLTGLGRSRLEGLGADDGLVDPRAATADAVATAGLWLGGLETLRAAPRVGPFAGKLSQALDEMRSCGAPAQAMALARFWPQLLGVALDDATADRAGRQVLSAARNLVFVLRTLPDDWAHFAAHALVLVSFPVEIGSELLSFLEVSSTGRPEKTRVGSREATYYDLARGLGFDEAGIERLAGSHYGLALSPKGAGLGWYYKMKPQPARRGGRGTLGFLHVNIGRLLALLAEAADESTRKAIKLAGSQLGVLGGNLTADGDLLRLDLSLGAP